MAAPPLIVGVTYSSSAAANAAAGVNTGSTIGTQSVAVAIIKAINAAGGLAGRMINPVYSSLDSTDTDFTTDADAACQKFTQDNHVDLVFDFVYGATYGFAACMEKARTPVISGAGGADLTALGRLPLEIEPWFSSFDRAYTNTIQQLVNTGYTSGKSVIGLIVDDCSTTQAALANSVKPLIARLGLRLKDTVTLSCPSGYGSLAGASQAITQAVLTFRTDNVDRVMILSTFEATALGLFAPAAESQQYRPGYMLTSYAEVAIVQPTLPSGQWPQLHGAGDQSPEDVASAPQADSPVEARCDSLSTAGGAPPTSWSDRYYVYFVCAPILLTELALKADGGVSMGSTLIAAIHKLGTTFLSPGQPANATDFTGSRTDGPSMVRLIAYDSGCSCMKYTTGPLVG